MKFTFSVRHFQNYIKKWHFPEAGECHFSIMLLRQHN